MGRLLFLIARYLVSFLRVCLILLCNQIYREEFAAPHIHPIPTYPPVCSSAVRPMAHIVSCMLEAEADDFTLSLNNYIAKAVTPQASNESVR